LIDSGDIEGAEGSAKVAIAALDRAAQKGVIHENNAAIATFADPSAPSISPESIKRLVLVTKVLAFVRRGWFLSFFLLPALADFALGT
jgi:hypothetical protein